MQKETSIQSRKQALLQKTIAFNQHNQAIKDQHLSLVDQDYTNSQVNGGLHGKLFQLEQKSKFTRIRQSHDTQNLLKDLITTKKIQKKSHHDHEKALEVMAAMENDAKLEKQV